MGMAPIALGVPCSPLILALTRRGLAVRVEGRRGIPWAVHVEAVPGEGVEFTDESLIDALRAAIRWSDEARSAAGSPGLPARVGVI